MKTRRLALRVTLHSSLMILAVYIVMQLINYFRDNIILGIADVSALPSTVFAFIAGSVLPPMILLSVVIYLFALPIQRVQRRLEAGETLEPELLEKTRRRILRFSTIVLVVNIIGFAVGYILNLAFSGHLADILKFDRLVVLVSNLAGGTAYAIAQSALNSLAFADLRDRLGFHAIGERKRELGSTQRQVILTAFLALYSLTLLQFNNHDVMTVQSFETRILDRVRSGEIQASDAGAEYRKLVAGNLAAFSSRASVVPESLPLPWERVGKDGGDYFSIVQEEMFVLYFLFMFTIVGGIQLAFSKELRDQLSALRSRIQDVVAGGGDLRLRLNLRNMDDIGDLTELINGLLDRFYAMASRIGESAGQTREGAAAIDRVLGSAEEISRRNAEAILALKADLENQSIESRALVEAIGSFREAVTGVNAAAETQGHFVSETSSAMEEMASNIRSVETMTERSGALVGRLADQGRSGGEAVRETAQAIAAIEEASKRILDVLGTLGKIASDTNLLAMNAAIEAAHAGEHGLGFAVVADEVRKLSTTSSSQTKVIRELVKTMTERVAQGVKRASVSGAALSDLVKGLEDAASISTEISHAMSEQATGTRSVADSLVQVVDSSGAIQSRMADQSTQTERMTATLTSILG
jgi:methyl-accepting chemotaxis protein